MNIWHDIEPKRIKPDDFVAVIEIPKGSKKKYELDKETGLIIYDYSTHGAYFITICVKEHAQILCNIAVPLR